MDARKGTFKKRADGTWRAPRRTRPRKRPKYIERPGMEHKMKKLQRERYRDLQRRGYVRCDTYLANLLRLNKLPHELGPETPSEAGFATTWTPAWLVWYLRRDVPTSLRDRLESAQGIVNDPEVQYTLLAEIGLQGRIIEVLRDMDADLSVQHAMKTLEKLIRRTPIVEHKDG